MRTQGIETEHRQSECAVAFDDCIATAIATTTDTPLPLPCRRHPTIPQQPPQPTTTTTAYHNQWMECEFNSIAAKQHQHRQRFGWWLRLQ